jgi:oxygen-independent coproporphyrinogen-3 oxidase
MNITNHPGIYIHIPFCYSKCGYCDFYSDTNIQLAEKFLTALASEIDQYSGIVDRYAVFDTIYLGGGTPSVLNPDQIHNILEMLRKNFTFDMKTELTIEINPGTINKDVFKHYISMDIKRLSIGVQSFSDNELRFLGRIHTAHEAINTIEHARLSGYDNINIDLIYALPGQSLTAWENTLKISNRFAPEHVSAYNLSIEQGTPFYTMLKNGQLTAPSQNKEADFFLKTHKFFTDSGYRHYEVSNFACNPEFISRHNYKYWNHTPYLSFGPSAHSFWDNKRWKNVRSTEQYIARLKANRQATDQTEALSEQQLIFESVFLGLRTDAGINLKQFKKEYHKEFRLLYADQIDSLQKTGHAVLNNDSFVLTQSGMLICDEISTKFVL